MPRDGTKNLIPLNKRTKEEQKEITTKGGKESGKRRRDKRTFRETLQALLELSRTTKDGKPVMSQVTGKPMSMKEEAAMTSIMAAIDGDVKHLQTILDVLGERSLKIDNTISGGLDAGITITHIVCDHTPAASEAEVIEAEGMEDYE